jgi:hypothetical protein
MKTIKKIKVKNMDEIKLRDEVYCLINNKMHRCKVVGIYTTTYNRSEIDKLYRTFTTISYKVAIGRYKEQVTEAEIAPTRNELLAKIDQDCLQRLGIPKCVE